MSVTYYSGFESFKDRVKEGYIFSFSNKKDRASECEKLGVESTFSVIDCEFESINNDDSSFLRVCELDDSPGFVVSMKGIRVHPKHIAIESKSMPIIVKKILLSLGWMK